MRKPYVRHVRFHTNLRGVSWYQGKDVLTQREERFGENAPVDADEALTQQYEGDAEDGIDIAHLEELLDDIVEGVRELDLRRSQSLGELQQVAVELSIAVASHLVKEKLDAGELNVKPLVDEAISRLETNQSVVIHVNPADKTALESALEDKLKSAARTFTLTADDRLPPGACRATAGEFGLLSTLEQRLATIRENLLQGIENARSERRTTGASGRGLQRFPDRRQTA